MTASNDDIELSIVMPCLNEAETVPICVAKARAYLDGAGIVGEVVVADNGSSDGSQDLAREHGARVVDVPSRGYGAALAGGISAARGRFVIMGDADDSYDFSRLDPFVAKLREGFDLVMGNRFEGGDFAPGRCPPCIATSATPFCPVSAVSSSRVTSATSTVASGGSARRPSRA